MVISTRTRADSGLGQSELLSIHQVMVLGREMDDAELRLRRQGRYLFQMSCAGHDVIQAVAARLLRPGHDWFYPYYRDRTFVLGLGVPPADLARQGFGKVTDPASGGRQMPNHWGSPELQIVSQSSPTGTQYLHAVGTAEAGMIARRLQEAQSEDSRGVKRRLARPAVPFHSDEVVYVSSGEGATSEGEFYEAVSTAALRRLPVLFVVEDNDYAISVPVEDQTPGGSISRVFESMPDLFTVEVNGCDVSDSWRGVQSAVDYCRRGAGPALVHAHVVRLRPHSDSDDDSLYRPAAEKELVAKSDPLVHFERQLLEAGHITEEEIETLHREIRTDIQAQIDTVADEPEPAGSTVTHFVLQPEIVTTEETTPQTGGEALTMIAAINRTLEIEMARDERIVVFGEDVADCSRVEHLDEVKGKGGVFKATENLQRVFGSDRVFNSQLAEASIVGRAFGMAVRGLRPVVEIQFFDYIWPAMMQIRNELGLLRWRSNNSFSCPVVIRVPIGGYVRGGAIYHSQSGESIFCHSPGVRVVMPSNARDLCGLLRASVRCGDPVLFLEHKHLYRQRYSRSDDPGPDHVVPLGKAATARPGKDVTVVTYGALVQKSLEAAERLSADGIEAEVIDLRSLSPYDWPAIAASVEKTSRLVVAYEENRSFGFGAEIAARVADELFEHLDAPVSRVASTDTHVGYSQPLADATLPSSERIEAAIRRTCRY